MINFSSENRLRNYRKKLPGLRFNLASLAVWTLFGLLVSTLLYSFMIDPGKYEQIFLVYFRTTLYFVIWALMTPIIYLVLNLVGVRSSKNLIFSTLIHVPLAGLLTAAHSLVFFPVMMYMGRLLCAGGGCPAIDASSASITTGVFLLGLITYLIAVIGIISFLIFQNYRREEARNLELKSDLANSQLEALKMQIQPHFLFNTLHSISSLTLADPQKANEMIARLGEFLRMTLENPDDQMTSLGNEIEFVRHYLEIEQVRFNDRLEVEIDVDKSLLKSQVPHLILQPIVENAIKHGIGMFPGNGSISIGAARVQDLLVIRIQNAPHNVTQTNTDANGKNPGMGLRNVRDRLTRIYGEDSGCTLSFDKNSARVEVKIPLAKDSRDRDTD